MRAGGERSEVGLVQNHAADSCASRNATLSPCPSRCTPGSQQPLSVTEVRRLGGRVLVAIWPWRVASGGAGAVPPFSTCLYFSCPFVFVIALLTNAT